MIAAILLAAGQSRRMGTQKLLLPFAGQTVIGHVADQFLQSRCDEVLVVVSPESPLRETLSQKAVRFVENHDLQGDMLSSVRAGIQALPDDYQTALITPGDMPLLQTSLINQLILAAHEEKIIVPVCEGKRGHPLLLSRDYFEEILTSYDGIGLRGLLQNRAEEVRELNIKSVGVLHDIDAPEDYQQALAEFAERVE